MYCTYHSKEETFVIAPKTKTLTPSPSVPEAMPLTGEAEVVSTRSSPVPLTFKIPFGSIGASVVFFPCLVSCGASLFMRMTTFVSTVSAQLNAKTSPLYQSAEIQDPHTEDATIFNPFVCLEIR